MPEVTSTYVQRTTASGTASSSHGSASDTVAELYDRGLHACQRGDRSTLRAVLDELVTTCDGPSGIGSRQAVHAFCLHQSAIGDLATVGDLLHGLRETWSADTSVRHAA